MVTWSELMVEYGYASTSLLPLPCRTDALRLFMGVHTPAEAAAAKGQVCVHQRCNEN